MSLRLALATLFALVLTAAADAAGKKNKKPDDSKTDPEKILKQLDGNNDGALTLDEFNFLPNVMAGAEKATPASLAATFAKLDADHNKKLTLDEFKRIKDVGLVKSPTTAKAKAKKKKTT